jgi:hypothetical protein
MHNGLMYAIGTSIMMEGVLSASYHVCPSSANYQFGRSFLSFYFSYLNPSYRIIGFIQFSVEFSVNLNLDSISIHVTGSGRDLP